MIEEKIIVGKNTEFQLNGLLTLPDVTTNPVPAVVFVHGSGTSDMNEKVGKMTPFKDLAHGLARHGIASIRYDKRSFSYGRKILKNKGDPITVREETIEDAILATDLLKNDPRIDSGRVFIVGHSMGGMLAPRIDSEGGDYRGLILMAGSPLRLEDIMKAQIKEIAQGMPGLLKIIVKGNMKKTTAMLDELHDISDEDAKAKKIGGGATLYYFKEMGEHPTSEYLDALHKPILIMQGEKDFQARVDRDFAAYREILKDKPDVTFKLYPGLNHMFVPSVYGDISKAKKEYNVEQHIGDEVIGDIADWILNVA